MNHFAKLRTLVLTFSAVFATVPWIGAQAPPASKGQTQKATSGSSSVASKLGLFVYPKSGQDRAQQAKDEGECYGWAQQQTGIDPAAPPAPQQAHRAAGGGAKGAALGAAAGGPPGAVVGAIRGRRQQKRAEQQAQKKTQTEQQKALDSFRKAFSACMDARQYSVK
jgi:hypothetical protein